MWLAVCQSDHQVHNGHMIHLGKQIWTIGGCTSFYTPPSLMMSSLTSYKQKIYKSRPQMGPTISLGSCTGQAVSGLSSLSVGTSFLGFNTSISVFYLSWVWSWIDPVKINMHFVLDYFWYKCEMRKKCILQVHKHQSLLSELACS